MSMLIMTSEITFKNIFIKIANAFDNMWSVSHVRQIVKYGLVRAFLFKNMIFEDYFHVDEYSGAI